MPHSTTELGIRWQRCLGIMAVSTGLMLVTPDVLAGKGSGGGGNGGGGGNSAGRASAPSSSAGKGGGGRSAPAASAPRSNSSSGGASRSAPSRPTAAPSRPSAPRAASPAPAPSRSAPSPSNSKGGRSSGPSTTNRPSEPAASPGRSQPRQDRPSIEVPTRRSPVRATDVTPRSSGKSGRAYEAPSTITVKPRGESGKTRQSASREAIPGPRESEKGTSVAPGTTRTRPKTDGLGEGINGRENGFKNAPAEKPRTSTTREAFAAGKRDKNSTMASMADSRKGDRSTTKFGKDSGSVTAKPAAVKTPTPRVDDLRSSQRRKAADAGFANVSSTKTKQLNDPTVAVNNKGYINGSVSYANSGGYSPRYGNWGRGDCGNGNWNSGYWNRGNCGWNNWGNNRGWSSNWCNPWYANGWSFSIGFGSYNSWFGFSYFDSYPCRPYYSNSWYGGYSPYVTYSYAPWWSSGSSYGSYQPTYITNNYYNDGSGGYTTTPPSSSQPSQYQDYTWLDGGGATLGQNDYSWLEPEAAAQTQSADQSQGGLVELWSAPQRELSTVEEGWTQFSSGDAHEARRVFLRAADKSPSDGVPQIGLALASGELNRYDDAVNAMRRALREDPESLNKVPNDPKVVQAINGMLDHYKTQLKQTPFDANALFMSAAMQYLLGQDALAYVTIDDAIDRGGDKDESAGQLKRLIREALNNSAPQSGAGSTSAPSTLSPGPLNSPSLTPPPPASTPERKQEVPF